MDVTDVFLARPLVIIAILASTENEHYLKSSLVTAVPFINAFAVA
jgi:hypothetical protein